MAAMPSRTNILIARLSVRVRRRAIREVYTHRNDGQETQPGGKKQPAIIPMQ
jgi:hypothetical protein